MICVGSPKNTPNATPSFFSLSCLCSIITAGLENKSRDNWFVGLRRSLFSRVIIRQLHYGWRRRNPSLAFTNIYREDVGREAVGGNAAVFNTKRSIHKRGTHMTRGKTCKSAPQWSVADTASSCEETQGGVRRSREEGGGMNCLFSRPQKKQKDRCSSN